MQLSNLILFGGSFDPIHVGHTNMANAALSQIPNSQMIVIPSYANPQKQTPKISPTDKLAMVRLAFSDAKNIQVSDYEVVQHKPIYTIQTIQHFHQAYPDHQLYLLIGSDQLENFSTWYQAEEILKLVKLVVYPRKRLDEKFKKKYPHVIFLKGKIIKTSSSELIKEIRLDHINQKVLNYINYHGLYATQRLQPLMSDHRYQHSCRVSYLAEQLMMKLKPEWTQYAKVAGLYHDICKEMPAHEQEWICQNLLGINQYVHWKVLHGYVGAYWIKKHYGFDDQLVLDAICRHTLPFEYYDSQPNLLDKVLYLADKLEPNRTDEDVFGKDINYFRNLAYDNIDKCFEELYQLLQSHLNK